MGEKKFLSDVQNGRFTNRKKILNHNRNGEAEVDGIGNYPLKIVIDSERL